MHHDGAALIRKRDQSCFGCSYAQDIAFTGVVLFRKAGPRTSQPCVEKCKNFQTRQAPTENA
jgi:hypothetical protein